MDALVAGLLFKPEPHCVISRSAGVLARLSSGLSNWSVNQRITRYGQREVYKKMCFFIRAVILEKQILRETNLIEQQIFRETNSIFWFICTVNYIVQ